MLLLTNLWYIYLEPKTLQSKSAKPPTYLLLSYLYSFSDCEFSLSISFLVAKNILVQLHWSLGVNDK